MSNSYNKMYVNWIAGAKYQDNTLPMTVTFYESARDMYVVMCELCYVLCDVNWKERIDNTRQIK